MFLIFGGESFYPNGGASDLLGSDADEGRAIEKAKGFMGKEALTYIPKPEDIEWDDPRSIYIEWVQVLRLENCEVIYKDGEPYGDQAILGFKD